MVRLMSAIPDIHMPMRLATAISVAFPDGGMTVSGLRREAARGRLVIERIAGKDFVTLAAINDMRERCRVQPKQPASGSGQPENSPPAPSSNPAVMSGGPPTKLVENQQTRSRFDAVCSIAVQGNRW